MKTIARILLIITVAWAVALSTLAVGAWYVVHKTGVVTVRVTDRDWAGDQRSIRFYFPAAIVNLGIRMLPAIHRWSAHGHRHYTVGSVRWDDDGNDRWHEGTWRHGWDHGGACFDDEDLREWLPAIRAAAEEIEKYPDATFVDIADGDERVKVMARGGDLIVEAHSRREDVEVRVPARTVSLALRTLQDL